MRTVPSQATTAALRGTLPHRSSSAARRGTEGMSPAYGETKT
eukprot:CAMPEP_0184116152 /NCGR_PEP_ID=MMETSP0974-20121125/20286_1 /TAXON_ID=483370 /ORGANISM="non described non described, Strain CCMP2097" /LENGTH=41 /DNA_ID= /DNA_START= /DNA_END= /DNA_ORIENTATION=